MENKEKIFLEVLENHKGIIYKISNSYCANSEDRKDVTQEIIVQLWNSFEKYDSQYKMSTWVYRIALNTAISFFRKNKSRIEKTTIVSDAFGTIIAAEQENHYNTDIAKLQMFIQELNNIDKAIILMYLDGLSQAVIAKIMGITPTNAGTKIGRIKKKLRKKFDKH